MIDIKVLESAVENFYSINSSLMTNPSTKPGKKLFRNLSGIIKTMEYFIRLNTDHIAKADFTRVLGGASSASQFLRSLTNFNLSLEKNDEYNINGITLNDNGKNIKKKIIDYYSIIANEPVDAKGRIKKLQNREIPVFLIDYIKEDIQKSSLKDLSLWKNTILGWLFFYLKNKGEVMLNPSNPEVLKISQTTINYNGDFTGFTWFNTYLLDLNLIKKVDTSNLYALTRDAYRFLENCHIFDLSNKIKSHNRIIYGAPGTGKSFKLREDLKNCKITKSNYNRVTLYPGVSYGQFVGSYKPKPDAASNITYEYAPGILMRTLISALENPSEDYVLVIEEVNRSKADSVFGDIFQMLDRNDEGESEYGITPPEELLNYLSEKTNIVIAEKEDYELKIPKNMYIWATMNSADQGVYPMDTAFKRRWTFEHIGLNENEDKFCSLYSDTPDNYLISYKYKNDDDEKMIGYVAWNDFRKAINSILLNSSNISEDRLLAPFFIKENDFDKNSCTINGVEKYVIKPQSFQSKILMYLFDDLLRHKKNSEIFNNKINSFSELKNGSENPFSVDPEKSLKCIFHSTLLSKLQECNSFDSEPISE